MKRTVIEIKYTAIGAFLGVAFLITAIAVAVESFTTTDPGDLTAPSSAAVENYIEEEHLDPIKIAEFETKTFVFTESSEHTLQETEESGDLSISSSSWSSNNAKVTVGVRETETPMAYVLFQDETLYEEAEQIHISSDNQDMIHDTGSGDRAAIISYGRAELDTDYDVTFYDSDGQVLYEETPVSSTMGHAVE
ncbi:hypothetical protein [Alkalicoccus chagannorensis]|uniref:hypothetical protein n=1 Tax=Alkalicoccus chagannorensis TaxID=427072 RepID=UPI0004212154|nr:hypothetical protein [Alkalicoccus chagannorensis]